MLRRPPRSPRPATLVAYLTLFRSLQRIFPGVIFVGAGSAANTTFSIRGQGKDVAGPGLPSVISYFNEVPLPSWGAVLPAFDVASVQVLKGPQGTLFGDRKSTRLNSSH